MIIEKTSRIEFFLLFNLYFTICPVRHLVNFSNWRIELISQWRIELTGSAKKSLRHNRQKIVTWVLGRQKSILTLHRLPANKYITINKTNCTIVKTIIQLNLNGYYRLYDKLQIIPKLHNPDLLCLQETNFKNNHHSTLEHYNTVRNRENGKCNKCKRQYYNKYCSIEIPLSTNLETVGIAISFPQKIHIL